MNLLSWQLFTYSLLLFAQRIKDTNVDCRWMPNNELDIQKPIRRSRFQIHLNEQWTPAHNGKGKRFLIQDAGGGCSRKTWCLRLPQASCYILSAHRVRVSRLPSIVIFLPWLTHLSRYLQNMWPQANHWSFRIFRRDPDGANKQDWRMSLPFCDRIVAILSKVQ